MAGPAELKAAPGDGIRRRYNQLVDWIDAQKIISHDDRITVHQTPNGQHVTLTQRPPAIVIPLQVRASGVESFSVAEGYINGRLPLIVTRSGQEVPLVDEDGVPHAAARLPADRPLVVTAEVSFKEDLSLDKILIVAKKPAELKRTGVAEVSNKSLIGHIPLAFIRGSVFYQFTLHNLQVRAYLDNATPRIIYWPA